jgi:hypothetical protein
MIGLGALKEVNEAEEDVKAAVSVYGGRENNTYLKLIFSLQLSSVQNEIMQKLAITDMTAEIKSLRARKDQLLEDSHKWIIENKDFNAFLNWHHGNAKRVLWIKGHAGKGKMMLLIGIVRELTARSETHFNEPLLSYFFCRGTETRLNTATSVLRGLIWMLLRQERSLIHHLDEFRDLGSKLFEDHNSFYSLKDVLQNMLQDKALTRCYLIIDALDECNSGEPGLLELLPLVSETWEKCDRVKWLLSSRNIRDIESTLDKKEARMRLSLEMNNEAVTKAVEAYINYKTSGLFKGYEKALARRKDAGILKVLRTVQTDVLKELVNKADGTFIWVALVFRQIKSSGCGADKLRTLLQQIPAGLNNLYCSMLQNIEQSEDYQAVLWIRLKAYSPIHISELASLAELPALADNSEIVRRCGLLVLKEEDDFVYFVHQSAKDFLTDSKPGTLSEVFLNGSSQGHRIIVSRSLKKMGEMLCGDILNRHNPSMSIDNIKYMDQDRIILIRYARVNWVKHLRGMDGACHDMGFHEGGAIDQFLTEHFLHWLVSLSLTRNMPQSYAIIRDIQYLLAVSTVSISLCIWQH